MKTMEHIKLAWLKSKLLIIDFIKIFVGNIDKIRDFTQIFYHVAVAVSLYFVISKGLWEYWDREEESKLAGSLIESIKEMDNVINENNKKIEMLKNEMWKNKVFQESFGFSKYKLLKNYFFPSYKDVLKTKDEDLMMFYVNIKSLETYSDSYKKLREEVRADLREVLGPRHLYYKKYRRTIDLKGFDFAKTPLK